MKKILFKTKKIYICNKLSSSSFEDEEVEGLKAEIDEGPLRVCEEAPKVRPHHTLPSSPIHPIKLLKPKINHQEEEEIIGFNYIFKLNFFFFFSLFLVHTFLMWAAMLLQSRTSKRSSASDAQDMACICIFTGMSVSWISPFPSNISLFLLDLSIGMDLVLEKRPPINTNSPKCNGENLFTKYIHTHNEISQEPSGTLSLFLSRFQV